MSSASTAPTLLDDIQYNQSTPRRWYSRNSAWTESGISTLAGAGVSTPPNIEACHWEPVNSMGSLAIASKANSRSSDIVATPKSVSSSSSWLLNSSNLRSTSATLSCHPGSSNRRMRSASRASASNSLRKCALEFDASCSIYSVILPSAERSAITHSPRKRIRPVLELTSCCISSSVSSISPTESFQSYSTSWSMPSFFCSGESPLSSLVTNLADAAICVHALGSMTVYPAPLSAAASVLTNSTNAVVSR